MIDSNAAVFDYWLQQIHAMTHRAEPAAASPELISRVTHLLFVEETAGEAHPFRRDYAQRKASFKRRWID